MVGSSPLVLLARKDFPANNIAELMKLLKENPGKYNYATSGVGTSLHVAGEMINAEGKVKMVHVPYKTGAQIPTDLMGNQIDLAVLPLVMAMQNVRAGNIKAFGITEPKRFELTPEVPSLAEHPDLKNVSGDGLVRAVRAGQDRSGDRREAASGAGRGGEGARHCREAQGREPDPGRQFAEGIRRIPESGKREIFRAGEGRQYQGGIAVLEPIPFEIRKRAIEAAQGRAPFDLLLRGARIADVATMEIRDADIGIVGPMIASVHAPGAFGDAKSDAGPFRADRDARLHRRPCACRILAHAAASLCVGGGAAGHHHDLLGPA